MSASYRTITGPDGKLARLEPFIGNSFTGAGDVDGAGYSVRSYATEIARVIRHPETGSFVRIVSERRYSTTTSRQQNACRAWLPGELLSVADGPDRGGDLSIPDDLKAREPSWMS